MMLQPVQSNPRRQRVATVREIKAPVGGWNARDDWTDMDATDAIVLDNLITRDGGVETRNGRSSHVTGLGSAVQSLMTWTGQTSVKLFGATASAIYDVTSAGAVGAAAVSSLLSGKWSHTNFSTTGGHYLVCANGRDDVRNYDGSSWTSPAITGVDPADLDFVTQHMARLWFIEKDSFKVWYLPALAIAGAATSINFGALCRKGGKLVAMASWTRDGGAGIDDHAVFITSEGEALVYSGSDPSSSTTWALVGIFSIPRPIGRTCVVNVGADVGILTIQGLLPLSAILPIAATGQSRLAITDKISAAFSDAASNAEDYHGWQVIESQTHKLLLVNVPIVEQTTQYQFVYNTQTQGWSRFTGLNMGCWGVANGQLYMGDNSGTIWKYSGDTDNGDAISWTVVHAFSSLGSSQTKNFRRIRPQLFTVAGYRPRVGLRVDYDDNTQTFTAPVANSSGTVWGSPWGSAWAASRANTGWWQSCIGEGYTVAPIVVGATKVLTGYNGCKLAYEVGRAL